MTKTVLARRHGRRRLDGARTPTGQLSRKLVDEIGGRSPAAVMRLVNEALRGYADHVYGAPLGRLFLDGKLTSAEFEAGKRWDRLIRRYHFAIGAPLPDPRAGALAMLEAPGPSAPADPDSETGRRQAEIDQEIISACRAAHALIVSYGLRAEQDMRRLCEGLGEFPPGAEALARAKDVLGGLARFWGLARRR